MDLLLHTKFYTPEPRPDEWIARPRLLARLDESLRRKLTLVSAPAGFGKTSLVADWLHRRSLPAAWLSLDESDNEPGIFWRYVIAALQTVQPALGRDLQRSLQATPPPSIEVILTALINEIAGARQTLLLVLDDYHVIANRAIDRGISFLVEHMPPHLHLVMASRSDPALPLARWRVSGDLVELRAAELRFTEQEAAGFFGQITGLQLSAENIASLEARTEGWIAGLQMAALSLQGNPNAGAFIDAFTGSHRYVMDYLADEVLERQTPAIRSFLLQTSILEQLCGELCAAVLAGDEGGAGSSAAAEAQATLVDLYHRNLFLVPLDDRNHWFRYHHLFADLLRRRNQQSGVDVAALHRRAWHWFEQAGRIDEALHHAFAAGEWSGAARLLEGPAQEALRYGRIRWAEERLAALPEEQVAARPNLLMVRAWLSYFKQQPAQLAQSLDQIEALAHHIAEDERRRQLLGQSRLLRAWILGSQDLQQSGALLHQALDLLPQDDTSYRGLVYLFLGLVLDHQGQWDDARQNLERAAALSLQADNISAYAGAHSMLADQERRRGQIDNARRRVAALIEWAQEESLHYLPILVEPYSLLARLALDQNDLQKATQYLAAALDKIESTNDTTRMNLFMRLGAARLEAAKGNVELAHQQLQQVGEQSSRWPPSVERRNLAVDMVRLALQLGDLATAERWWDETGIQRDQPLAANTPEAWATLVHLCLARHRAQQTTLPAASLLDLLADLRDLYAPMLRHQVEFALLEAMIHDAGGETTAATAALLRAVELAAPQRYMRPFLDAGEPVRRQIQSIAGATLSAGVRTFVDGLLVAGAGVPPPQVAIQPAAGAVPPLLDPLTEREVETLRLLATDLSIAEIAAELVVTVATVRSYCKRIYSKLDVHSRIEAVARAQQLALL